MASPVSTTKLALLVLLPNPKPGPALWGPSKSSCSLQASSVYCWMQGVLGAMYCWTQGGARRHVLAGSEVEGEDGSEVEGEDGEGRRRRQC